MYRIFVITHVAAGLSALIAGLLAMRAKKGSKFHLKSGITYYYLMLYVCLSALIIQFFHFIPFLGLISLFSLYFVLMGKWVLRYKKNDVIPNSKEKATIIMFTLTGIAMITYAVFGTVLSIVILIFGIAAVIQGVFDLKHYYQIEKANNWYLVEHINKIGASYIAAVTAFIVNNVNRFDLGIPAIVIWIGPGVIGGFFISSAIKTYDKKKRIQNA